MREVYRERAILRAQARALADAGLGSVVIGIQRMLGVRGLDECDFGGRVRGLDECDFGGRSSSVIAMRSSPRSGRAWRGENWTPTRARGWSEEAGPQPEKLPTGEEIIADMTGISDPVEINNVFRMGDAREEDFERAITEARAEGDLSRANLVRHLKAA